MTFTKYAAGGAYHWGKLGGRTPRTYHARLWARYGWFVDRVREAPPGVVVDVGAGDAALSHLVASATGRRVLGVEPEAEGVEEARRAIAGAGSSVEIVHGRGESLPADDRAAAAVLLCEVIEHVDDPDAVVAEAARVVAPDGVVAISTPQRQVGQPLPPFHLREYQPSELEALCRRHFGTVVVQVAEPPRLLQLWHTRPGRIAVAALALVGANPFRTLRAPAGRRARWRELYVVARDPRTHR